MKTVKVGLSSLGPVMFNAFRGQEQIPPERKLHYGQDGKTLILPVPNILGFLTSTTVGRCCVNTFVPPKQRPAVKAEVMASVVVRDLEVPLLDNGKPITLTPGEWTDKVRIDARGAQASKTSRDIVLRPVIEHPWAVSFTLLINETDYVTSARMREWFERGGIVVGFGAFRPFFGKFEVIEWAETKSD